MLTSKSITHNFIKLLYSVAAYAHNVNTNDPDTPMFLHCTLYIRAFRGGDTGTWCLFLMHADKGKKSRFRQLTDLVKTGMSAATSKVNSIANSRAPSRGITQDLEGFETTSKQTTQAAIEPVSRSQDPRAFGQTVNVSTALTEAQPGESANDTAFSRPVAEGHAHSSQAEYAHTDTFSEFAEILAAQPFRGASSAVLLSPSQQAQQPIDVDTTQIKVINRQSNNSAKPIAEGTETRQPVKASSGVNLKPSPKMGAGFMSGASTGCGAVVQAPATEAATAFAAKARSTEPEPESGLHQGAFPDDDLSMQR